MTRSLFPFIASALLLAACGGSPDSDGAPGNGGDAAGQAAAAPTGTVIEIRAITDEKGNYFEPSRITAKPGDVLRVVNVSGVHNLHFLPDSNPTASGLPPATDMLGLPGQTAEVPVTMGPGQYYFQCDPHALLGMVGHLEVQE